MIRTPETTLDKHDPGTSDRVICVDRLLGRMQYRDNPEQDPEEQPNKEQAVQWWLGWYDERLRRWYGR